VDRARIAEPFTPELDNDKLESRYMTRTNLQLELQQMYARTEHWISDYLFFEDEIKFLINLLDRYFIGMIVSDSTRLEVLRQSARKLMELDKERESIAKENQETLLYLTKLLKNETAFDPNEFRETYADIENEHVGFLKRYRLIKKEIYDLGKQLKTTSNS
jgi:hypothetical protein